jgi:multisubunit Na+/H+ antiporter MnhF subunit
MTPFHSALGILILLMAVSLVICFIRLFIGPSLPNRTVAFDTIAVHAAGIIVLFAMLDEARALLSVALITAVLGFLGTTVMARYLERSAESGWRSEYSERAFRIGDD